MRNLWIVLLLVCFSLKSATVEEFINSDKINTNFKSQANLMVGFVENIPWEGNYWPNRAGSIAYRHKDNEFLKFYSNMLKGVKPNLRKLRRKIRKTSKNFYSLEKKDIDKLSAAEKYDLLLEDFNFSFTEGLLTKVEENNEKWRGTTWWTGICHGWAPASIKYKKPVVSKTFTNSLGHQIEFTPEDLKGLSSYFISSSVASKKTVIFGNRCNQKKPKQNKNDYSVIELTNFSRSKDECSDITAHDFHSVLINKVGIQKESFTVDVDYNAPVNNHPIAGYSMKVVSKTNTKVSLHTKVYYVNWTRPGKSRDNESEMSERYLVKDYYYDLFLNNESDIVSSDWINEKNKVWAPDFMWFYLKETKFNEYYIDASNGLEFNLDKAASKDLIQASFKSSNNSILLNYLNRLSSRESKKKGIYKKALKYAKLKGIKLIETRDVFEKVLNDSNIRKEQAHPQLLKLVIDKLMDN